MQTNGRTRIGACEHTRMLLSVCLHKIVSSAVRSRPERLLYMLCSCQLCMFSSLSLSLSLVISLSLSLSLSCITCATELVNWDLDRSSTSCVRSHAITQSCFPYKPVFVPLSTSICSIIPSSSLSCSFSSFTASALNKPPPPPPPPGGTRLLHLGSAVALGVLLVQCVSLE